MTKDGKYRLYRHDKMPIRRHVKVKGTRSPYDGDFVYWATRQGKHPQVPKYIAILLKRQHGKCVWCNLYFKAEDLAENDHVVPTARKGGDATDNRQLLHRHCYDEKTAGDGSRHRTGAK